MGEAGGFGVVGAADEASGAWPGGGCLAADFAEGQGAALGDGEGVGLDGEFAGAVVVSDGEGEGPVVAAYGCLSASEAEVACGFGLGSSRADGDFGMAEVERDLGRGTADQPVVGRVIEVAGGFAVLGDGGEVAFGVPGELLSRAGDGVARGVIGVGLRAASSRACGGA